MHITGKTLDELLRKVYGKLLSKRSMYVREVVATKGRNFELTGVCLKLLNPRARLSRSATRSTLFSCVGELLWYLSGSDNVHDIAHYIGAYKKFAEHDGRVNGAYGPRLFSGNPSQFDNVRDKLSKSSGTRKAVIQIFQAKDIVAAFKDVPCTCTLQFLLRDRKLDLVVYMRSNDAFIGMAHDIFCFTMLQEIMARSISAEVGIYTHMVGSLHLYQNNLEDAKKYLDEGILTEREMPEMPKEDPWPSIRELLSKERHIRKGDQVVDMENQYWGDLLRVIRFVSETKILDSKSQEKIIESIHHDFYKIYLMEKYNKTIEKIQLSLI